MSADYKIEIPTSCGPNNMNSTAFTQSEAVVCIPEQKYKPNPAEAVAIGGGILALMAIGALFASRHGVAS